MALPTDSTRSWRPFWITLAILGAVLAWLWRDSFDPRMLAFANDAPYGMMSAYSEFRWSNFWSGSWNPQFWLGMPALPLQPAFSHGLFLLGGPLAFAKFAAPLSMLLLGLGAYAFCRQQKFNPAVATLTALAAALNLNFLSYATWGLGVQAAAGASLLARRALKTGSRGGWIRAVIAGIATGYVVIEGADAGALMTVFIAAYALWVGWIESGTPGSKLVRSGLRLALVVGFSVWIAAYTLSTLIGTQIQGVAGMGETAQEREQRWQFVSGLSFPKLEVVRMAVPGIMGIRSISSGEETYWGSVGGDLAPPRFNGGSEFVGILVLILAGWSVVRALSSKGRQPYSNRERQLIGFWSATALVTLLLAFGHYAPFYQVVFALPYFSTIRGPMKFLHITHLALIILFAYGLQGVWRLYVEGTTSGTANAAGSLKKWWDSARDFDRSWSRVLVILAGGSLLMALVYASYLPSLANYLVALKFSKADSQAMAAFSVREVCWAVALVVLSCGALSWIAAGRFANRNAHWAAVLLGGLLLVDLVRAASPFILHYNYQRRYEKNPVTDFLAKQPWEHRVSARPFPTASGATLSAPGDGNWRAVHNQWLEHQMPFNEIQTLDIWQMPRRPELDDSYIQAFSFESSTNNNFARVGRLWDLTNVRFVLGAQGIGPQLDQLFAGGKSNFKPVLGFDLAAKPGTSEAGVTIDDLTVVTNPNGQYAVFENTSALPRAKLFSNWEVIPDNAAALDRLRNPAFDPASTVVLDAAPGITPNPASTNAGTATITAWTPKQVTVQTDSGAPAVLLLNDRWHADWKVTVDGTRADLRRANDIMRAVAVPAGKHTVEFRYQPNVRMLTVSLAALGVALVLGVWLVLGRTEDGTP